MKKKYIFFDIDGVLNTESSWNIPFCFDKEKVKLLAEIAKETNSSLIMSSTWKNGWDADIRKCTPQVQNMRKILQEYQIDILAATPNLKNRTRDKEIERFLYSNPCDDYIILDDDLSLFEKKEKIYKIDGKVGLTERDKKEIEKRLNGKKKFFFI